MRHRSRVRFAGALATTALLVALSWAASVSAAPSGVTKAADLFAGKTTDVGDVFVWNDATNLYVEIDLVPGWCMTESHVAVASTSTAIPQTKTGNPIPGKFAYGDTYDPCADGDVFTVPLSGSDATPEIAVHAKVWDKSQTALMNVFSNGGNTTVTASTAGGTLPRLAVDAWEAFGDPVDPTPSTWDNGVGTGTFADADWIWSEYRVNTPTVDETATFLRTFTVPGPVAPGSWMKVTTDDAYTASLNGTVVASDTWPNWPSVESASPFVPVMGPNTLGFVATNSNLSYGSGGTIDNNPGGLIYEARINYYAHSESAWAGTAIGVTQFTGANWATHFKYAVVDWADTSGAWVSYNAYGLDRQAKFSFGAAGGEFWYNDTTGSNAYHVTLTQGAFSPNTAYACGTVDAGAFVGSKLLLKVTDATVDLAWGSFVGGDPCTGLGTVTPGDGPFAITGGQINVLNVP